MSHKLLCLLALVLMGVAFTPSIVAEQYTIGYIVIDTPAPGEVEFDITNVTGINDFLSPDPDPVTTSVNLSDLSLQVGTTTYGSSYFTLNADGISWDGSPLALSAIAGAGQLDATVQFNAGWYCWGLPCTATYNFASNAYWDTAGGGTSNQLTGPHAFYTTNSAKVVTYVPFTATSGPAWQGTGTGQLGEDAGSIIADPHFKDVACGGSDDYTITDMTTANAVNFIPFDLSAPGRTSTNGLVPPTTVPTEFPLVVPPCSYY